MFSEEWYYSMESTTCSILETLDLEDYYFRENRHKWPGLDDTIEEVFSAAITGFINIGMAATYNFTLAADDNAMIFFDDSLTPLIDIEGESGSLRSVTKPIHLTSGRHLMRLYYSNNGGYARLKLTYSSSEAGLPETTVDKEATFVGGQAPSFQKMSDIRTIVSGTVKANRPVLAGSYVTAFTVSPNLPTGLRLNGVSGVISGVSSSPVNGDYTVTATGPLGSAAAVIHLSISGSPLAGLSAKYYKIKEKESACYQDSFKQQALTLLADTIDADINHPLMRRGAGWAGIPGEVFDGFYVEWSGYLRVDVAGDYEMKVDSRDGVRVYVDGIRVLNRWECPRKMVITTNTVSFGTVGYVSIQVNFFSSGSDFGVILSWKKPNTADFEVIPASMLVHVPSAPFTYTASTMQYYRNMPVAENTPVFFGVSLANPTYSINPELPAGLTLQSNGVISGTPSADAEEKTYTLVAASQSTSYTTHITLQVKYVAPPSALKITDTDKREVTSLTLTQFTKMSTLYLSAENNPRLWSIQPDLPSGLTVDWMIDTIKGTPLVALAQTMFTVTASNSGGSVSKTLSLTVTGCQYGKWFYISVTAYDPVSFTLKKASGEVVYQNDNIASGDYGMSMCIPDGDYLYTFRCTEDSGRCSLKIIREDKLFFLSQQTTDRNPLSGEFSTTVKEKATLSIEQPPELLGLKHLFSLQFNATGVFKPLYAVPSLPDTVRIDESASTLTGTFYKKGTYSYEVIAENDMGKVSVALTFHVGTCPDGKGMITLSRSSGDYKDSMVVTSDATGDVITSVEFTYDDYSSTLCLPNGDYKVVMKTTQEEGSWNAGSELLVKDSWDDLLASTMLDNGKGEKTEYFTINYAIMDRLPMRFYNQAKAPASKWKEINFNDGGWAQGDYSSFGNFTANTAYFRKEFEVDNRNKYSILAFDLEILDGMIVYINGQEVIRRNMPAAGVTHQSMASSRYDSLFWRRTAVPTSMLQNGKNVLAVELHRSEGVHTGIVFDVYGSLLSGECIKRTDRGRGKDSEHTPRERYNPANAFDNDLQTTWQDSNLPVHLQFTYDYDRYEFINKIVLMAGNEYKSNMPKQFEILGMANEDSDGGDVLATVDDRNLFTSPYASTTVFLKSSQPYNVYRMRVDETNDNSNTASIAEMMLYTCRLTYCPKQKGWDSVQTGETASGACSRSTFGEAKRSCELDRYDPKWSAVDYSNCLSTNPPSQKAYIDFKYMVSNCTLRNFDAFVKDRFIDITRDILLAKKEDINLFLIQDCSDSETVNVCFYVRVTTELDISSYVFKHMNQLQEEMSYRMYTNPPRNFPEGMYFVMVMNPLLRTPASKMALIVVIVLVLVIVIGTGVFVYNIRSEKNVRKVRGGVTRKSTIETMQDRMERNKKEKAGLLGQDN